MAFDRPTLSELRQLVAQDISSELPGSDPLLRFSNLGILGTAVAGLAHLQYAYLDWISRMAIPVTSEGEFLEMWAQLKGVTRIPPAQATGFVTFSGANGRVLPSGTALSRADGKTFTTTADGTVSGGAVTVPAVADVDPDGLAGSWGNMDAGSVISLGTAIAGINSSGTVATAFTGGSDLETDDALKSRMLDAFQNPAQGGAAADYIAWAKAVPGVTRAWCPASVMGAGTVQVFVMLDTVQAAHGGFPQGVNGTATAETRDIHATGDQLSVANAIYSQQPVTALVYVVSPTGYVCNFTISGLSSASVATKAAVTAAIGGVLLDKGVLQGVVALSDVESAISSVAGTAGFVITSPTSNLTAGAGQIHTLGTITWV